MEEETRWASAKVHGLDEMVREVDESKTLYADSVALMRR
jgi:hypothetical protein